MYNNTVSLIVPPPELSVSPPIGPVYGGSTFELNCSILVSAAVNSDVVVTSMWRRNGVLIENSAQTRMTDARLINSTMYQSQLMFSRFQLNTGDGLYTCEVTIESAADLEFVLSSVSLSNSVRISAVGKLS